MARLTMLPLDNVEGAEKGATEGNLINQDVFRILAHRPQAARSLLACINDVYSSGTLSKRLMELIRLRIAFHNQCRSCMSIRFSSAVDDGVSDEVVCSLERPAEAPNLTDTERVALKFADLFATNHLAIDEGLFEDLRQHFDEGEIVELSLHCALCVGTGRMAATWHVVDHVPDRFKAEGVVTPWEGNQLLVRETKKDHLGEASTPEPQVGQSPAAF
jgi:AhpD family alkylhydroperoxidase